MTVETIIPFSALGEYAQNPSAWESASLRMIAEHLGPDDVVLEAGAGAGATALAAARIARRVVTCDPDPAVAAAFLNAEVNRRLPGNMTFVHCALGVEGGDTLVRVSSRFWDTALAEFANPLATDWRLERVPRLDIRGLAEGLGATFVMLDAEGAEAHLLPAVAEVKSVRAILVEFHPWLGAAPFVPEGFAPRSASVDGSTIEFMIERL